MKDFLAAKERRKVEQKQQQADYKKGQLDAKPKVARPQRQAKPAAKKTKTAVKMVKVHCDRVQLDHSYC